MVALGPPHPSLSHCMDVRHQGLAGDLGQPPEVPWVSSNRVLFWFFSEAPSWFWREWATKSQGLRRFLGFMPMGIGARLRELSRPWGQPL